MQDTDKMVSVAVVSEHGREWYKVSKLGGIRGEGDGWVDKRPYKFC